MAHLFQSWKHLLNQGTGVSQKRLMKSIKSVIVYLDSNEHKSPELREVLSNLRLFTEGRTSELLLEESENQLTEIDKHKKTELICPPHLGPYQGNQAAELEDRTIEIVIVKITPIESWVENGEYRMKMFQLSSTPCYYGVTQNNYMMNELRIKSVGEFDRVHITMLNGVARKCFIMINRAMELRQSQNIQLSETIWFTISRITRSYIEIMANTEDRKQRFTSDFTIGRNGTLAIEHVSLDDLHVSISFDPHISSWVIRNIGAARADIILHVPDILRLSQDSAPALIYDGTEMRIDHAKLKFKLTASSLD